MTKELVEQIKQSAKETYLHMIDVVSDFSIQREYREKVITAINSKNSEVELQKIGIKGKLAEKVTTATKSKENRNVFTAFLFLDWTGYFTYEDINLFSLKKFFDDRPKVSPSAISEEAGFSAKYLRLILNEERNLTDNVIEKLRPILTLYGWGSRGTCL